MDLDEKQIREAMLIEKATKHFLDTIDTLIPQSGGSTRELALAKTKVQEAQMWATKHITGY